MDFSNAKVQIETTIFSPINAWIYFVLDGIAFDIHVAEDAYGSKRDVEKMKNTSLASRLADS